MTIQHVTTHTMPKKVARDIQKYQKVQSLAVDIFIFGCAPLHLWLNFPNLRAFIIILYPNDIRGNYVERPANYDYDVYKPHRGSKHGKRRAWEAEVVTKSFDDVKQQHPSRKIPSVQAVIRRDETDFDEDDDDPIGGYCDQGFQPAEQDFNNENDGSSDVKDEVQRDACLAKDMPDRNEDDDTEGLEDATKAMSHEFSDEEMHKPKHHYARSQ